MNKTRLIFVRHGESEANLAGVFVGHQNSPLTEKGHAQAEMTAEFLKDEKIDVFYASDLIRAADTGRHIAARHGAEIILNEHMREICGGEWENKKFADLPSLYPEEYGLWLSDIGKAAPHGGESVRALYERITAEAAKIARENMGKTVLIATHATPIRALTCLWRQTAPEDMRLIPWPHNASVSTADYYEDGRIELVSADVFDFMGEDATALPKNV